MRKSLAFVALTALWVLSVFGQEVASSNPLELEEALRLALERNPGLRAANLGVQAADGQLLQAGTILNPILSAEVENFGGKGGNRGFDGSDTTMSLEQTIELGGKRVARRNSAVAGMKLAEWGRDTLRLAVIRETKDLFIDAQAAQEELALSQEAWQTAENIYQAVSNRVAAGKDSPVEDGKARTELALARLDMARAKSRVAVSRKALCAMWVDSTPDFTSVHGSLAVAGKIPTVELLHEAMTHSPGWARWPDEILSAESALQRERSSRIPDLTIGVGLLQSQADDSRAFVASAGVELPIFDRKRGNVLTAQAELDRKHAEKEAAQTALRVELAAAHELLTTMHKEALTIAQDALPAAEQAFTAAQAYYANGKTGYLDIQDARRLLIDTRRQKLETLTRYHHAVALVEQLAGASLDEITWK
jgi:cobalt-zinc-cadmium efflux system outer membrane protein